MILLFLFIILHKLIAFFFSLLKCKTLFTYLYLQHFIIMIKCIFFHYKLRDACKDAFRVEDSWYLCLSISYFLRCVCRQIRGYPRFHSCLLHRQLKVTGRVRPTDRLAFAPSDLVCIDIFCTMYLIYRKFSKRAFS